MKIKIDPGAYYPERAHANDAGLDLRSTESGTIPPRSAMTFGTGVHVQLPKGTAGLLVSKSGLDAKHHITSTGLIDEGYRGEIRVTLHNDGDMPIVVDHGQKISQLVVLPVLYENVEIVDKLDESEDGRGEDGFGSTGRF